VEQEEKAAVETAKESCGQYHCGTNTSFKVDFVVIQVVIDAIVGGIVV
jgi:hypothetical protein